MAITNSVAANSLARSSGRMSLQTRHPPVQAEIFPPRRDYASLSIKDLLDAREAYHVHLSLIPTVIATAIGRYFIHQDDWYAQNPPDRPRPSKFPRVKAPRTLANSVIRPWSWPAVLVFVRDWNDRGTPGSPSVPRTLYLPDGRLVPTCVIEAAPDEYPDENSPARGPFNTSALMGGGYSCIRKHQGEQSTGTFACLVKKAGEYYALTNRHVSGGDGEIVSAYIRGQYQPIGRTSNIAVDRLLMSTLFPSWPGQHSLLTLDAGLIRIEDINDWTSQAFGIGEIGEVFDATDQTVTLDLIGCPVRAFGGSTGVMEGEIRGLFFRYEAVGGIEHATDVLIGPKRKDDCARIKDPVVEHPVTHPGDSGTLWFYDPPKHPAEDHNKDFDYNRPVIERGLRARRLRPIAMQWGGERVVLPDGTKSAYALGSFLSSICQSLDVEVVRDWSLGHDEYWGKIGHFAIGWKACDQLSGPVSDLLRANQPRIAFDDSKLKEGSEFRVARKGFVPLADVPDYVWITQGIGGRWKPRQYEAIQHFADIDIHDIDGGLSLLQRCAKNSDDIVASRWKEYFDGFARAGVGPDQGVLPFRVWQIWQAMVDYLGANDVLRFVAAAGVLAHYVGDASQPLHCSYMHHGVPPMLKRGGREYPIPKRLPGEKSDTPEYKKFKKTRAAKIHGIYEETMLEVDPADALQRVDTAIKNLPDLDSAINNGHDAAAAVIQLMARAQDRLSPRTIIDADNPKLGPKARAEALWEDKAISNATAESLADSVRVLAALWSSAWDVGGGTAAMAKANGKPFDEKKLDAVYRRDPKFVPSLSLDEMAASRQFEAPSKAPSAKKRPAGRPRPTVRGHAVKARGRKRRAA